MTFRLRPFAPADSAPLEEILQENWGDEAERSQYDRYRPDSSGECFPLWRTLVAELEGRVVGFGSLWENAFHPAGAYLGINVAQAARGRGVGSRLFAALTAELKALRGPKDLRAATTDAKPEALEFLKRRGFVETRRTYTPLLELKTANVDLPETAFQGVRAAGYRLLSLAQLEADPERDDKVAGLYRSLYTRSHIANAVSDQPLEVWRDLLLDDHLLAGVIVAVKDDRYVALGMMSWLVEDSRAVGTGYGALEGQPPDLTLAIVRAQVHFLERRGLRTLEFEIDSDDADGMWLLERLPLTPRPVFVTLLRVVPDQT